LFSEDGDRRRGEGAIARLLESQGKQLLAEEGIRPPRGSVAATADEARRIAAELGVPVVVKAQIRLGGRGRVGGIKFAASPQSASAAAADLLGKTIRGAPVETVLVEEQLQVARELYLGIVVDSSQEARCPVVIVSSEGGMDVEEVPKDRVSRCDIDILLGLRAYQCVDLARRAGIPPELLAGVSAMALALYGVFRKYECRTIEINPVIVTPGGDLIAADCRVAVDDSALYRHPELGVSIAREMDHEPTALDRIAWSIEEGDLRGTGYVAEMFQEIEAVATIGYHGLGGGGAILGVDALNRAGLRVANYADTSGNPTAAKVYRVAKLVLSQPGIDGYLVGGFMVANQEQWHHAHGLVKALREELPGRPDLPVVILLCGNREPEAMEILHEGLAELSSPIEIYGRDRVYDTDFIAGRMRVLVDEYRTRRGG
jgi:succinyl-CoA synthetase beta subunit